MTNAPRTPVMERLSPVTNRSEDTASALEQRIPLDRDRIGRKRRMAHREINEDNTMDNKMADITWTDWSHDSTGEDAPMKKDTASIEPLLAR